MARARAPVPPDLRRAARHLDAWRRSRRGRSIPGRLWAAAVALARRHGVSPTARALRLDYASLRGRVERSGAAGRPFVEVVAAPAGRTCVVEVEDGRGARMRVRLAGEDVVAPLEALARSFWSRRR